jgi:circadian clock protein KaiC
MAAQAELLQDAGPVPSGSAALDRILGGGYAANRIHLLEGAPGAGKTTLGLQFLLEGAAKQERCLYITMSESRHELLQVASTHGWDLDGIDLFELVPPELSLDPEREQSIVYASDLELGETVSMVMAEVERAAPARIVFDSLSEIRLLAQGSLRYRRQVLALKHFFAQHKCTSFSSTTSPIRPPPTISASTASPTESSGSSRMPWSTAPSGGGFECSRCAAAPSSAATTISRSGPGE